MIVPQVMVLVASILLFSDLGVMPTETKQVIIQALLYASVVWGVIYTCFLPLGLRRAVNAAFWVGVACLSIAYSLSCYLPLSSYEGLLLEAGWLMILVSMGAGAINLYKKPNGGGKLMLAVDAGFALVLCEEFRLMMYELKSSYSNDFYELTILYFFALVAVVVAAMAFAITFAYLRKKNVAVRWYSTGTWVNIGIAIAGILIFCLQVALGAY